MVGISLQWLMRLYPWSDSGRLYRGCVDGGCVVYGSLCPKMGGQTITNAPHFLFCAPKNHIWSWSVHMMICWYCSKCPLIIVSVKQPNPSLNHTRARVFGCCWRPLWDCRGCSLPT